MRFKILPLKKSLLNLKIISIFTFLLLSPLGHGGNCLYLALADFSSRADIDRHDEIKDFWKAYKSDPLFASYLDDELKARGLQSDYMDQLFNYPSTQSLLPIKDEVYKIFEDYKKLPPFEVAKFAPKQPKVVDLSLGFLKSEPAFGGEVIPWFRANWSVETRALTNYEADLLRLRSGDTVNIDGQKFVLGKFLGAGNTTHVYEVLDANGKANSVIRLPAVADFIVDRPSIQVVDNRWISPGGTFRDDIGMVHIGSRKVYQGVKKRPRGLSDQGYTGFKFNRQYVEQSARAKCAPRFMDCYYKVKIIDYDKNYRWVTAEKLDFLEDGNKFLEDNKYATDVFKITRTDKEYARILNMSEEEVTKLRQKYARLEAVNLYAKMSGATDSHYGQFNWGIRPDTGEWDWILTDW